MPKYFVSSLSTHSFDKTVSRQSWEIWWFCLFGGKIFNIQECMASDLVDLPHWRVCTSRGRGPFPAKPGESGHWCCQVLERHRRVLLLEDTGGSGTAHSGQAPCLSHLPSSCYCSTLHCIQLLQLKNWYLTGVPRQLKTQTIKAVCQ